MGSVQTILDLPDGKAATGSWGARMGIVWTRSEPWPRVGDFIYANRVDAGFRTTGMMPCASRPNGIYDKYSSDTGELVMSAFIRATFPASGIAFNGTYFFVSDICNNGIAVYASDGTFIAEATLPLPIPGGGTSVCVNPALIRCIEDLSILQSGSDSSEAK